MFPTNETWPYLPTLIRLALALAMGLFVGLERERRGKEAGMRTFAFAALLGCLGGLLGTPFALLCLALLGLLIFFMNYQRLSTNQTVELTTSVVLLIAGVMGVLFGMGHTFTPVTIGIAVSALLAWKEHMTQFSVGLTEAELRSAILLGIITFVVYPLLPAHALDPYHLIEPRATWMTVILIAAFGFVNYILLKLYGSRGAMLAGFLGGLINSKLAVTELSARVKEVGGGRDDRTYEGVLLVISAMLIRNCVVLGMLAFPALVASAAPLAIMLAACGTLLVVSRVSHRSRVGASATETEYPESPSTLRLQSPFSLQSALKFGALFLALHVAGTLAQRAAGPAGFYAVSAVGGLVSSASAVASAATLCASGHLSPTVAANGAILSSLSSALINLPLVYRIAAQRPLSVRLTRAVGLLTALGVVGILLQVGLNHLLVH